MAKVMISMPEELLAEVDRIAAARNNTRSATVRAFAEEAIRKRDQELIGRMAALEGHASSHSGDVVRDLKMGRPR